MGKGWAWAEVSEHQKFEQRERAMVRVLIWGVGVLEVFALVFSVNFTPLSGVRE